MKQRLLACALLTAGLLTLRTPLHAQVERSGGGEPVFFCSEECRNKFMDEPRKFAANA